VNKYELLEYLRTLDEVTLVEILEISSKDLVDSFLDKIEDNQEKLYALIREED
jgi:hypothetical protein